MKTLAAVLAILLCSASVANAQYYGAPNCSSPATGYAAPVGGLIDNTLDSALDRFVNNYELKMSIQRRAASAYAPQIAYGVPVYAPPAAYSAPVFAAPIAAVQPQAFYVPNYGYTSAVVPDPMSPSGYSAQVAQAPALIRYRVKARGYVTVPVQPRTSGFYAGFW